MQGCAAMRTITSTSDARHGSASFGHKEVGTNVARRTFYHLYAYFTVFPEGLVVDMASKNISRCTVSYTALSMKTDLHFEPTLLKL